MSHNTEGLFLDPATGTISAVGPDAVALVALLTVASGAALYLNTGMKPNRAYTPTAMRDALNRATGSKAKNLKAALTAYVEAMDAAGRPVTNPSVLKAVGR